MKAFTSILSATLLALPLYAQLVNDGATNTLSNVTNIVPGNVIVGTNGSFTLLVLSDNSLVTNSAHVVIGANATAKSNAVQLVSPTARLQIGGSTGFRFLLVGSNGASSRLVVSNGAQVVANGGSFIGFGAPTSNNVAIVTGPGSVWSEASQLSVGQSGGGNQLIVTNGGQVLSGDGRIGSVGSNNQAVVTGTGSHWTNQTDFYVGVGGSGNRLAIENGGRLSDGAGYLGANSTSWSNEVVVTGSSSLWSNRLDLQIGLNGGFNRLVLSNGGWVINNNAVAGLNTTATNNEVVVTGVNSTWSNRADLTIGQLGGNNRLEINNGGQVVNSNGFVGVSVLGRSNAVLVTGTDSLWSNQADLSVSASSQLVISNGGRVANRNGLVGDFSGANVVLATGAGSSWSNRGDLYVGNSGAVNLLVVSNGAVVSVGTNAMIGKSGTASGNSVVVTDPGSSFVVGTNFYVGSNGVLNRLVISNGATVFHGRFGGLGYNAGSVSNEAVVVGPGSAWRYEVINHIGLSGAYNRLTITNGGLMTGNYGGVGGNVEGSNNLVIVTGPGSVWSNRLDFDIGSSGSRNRLVVSDGGRVDSDNGYIGQNSIADDNGALVTGPGSSWINLNLLEIGRQGSRSLLTVTNGGLVSAKRVVMGEFALSANNRVVVDGGMLQATSGGASTYDVRRGTNVLNAGTMEVDRLLLTNAQGFFEFNGGTLITRGAIITNVVPFVVGVAGSIPAVWQIRPGAESHLLNVPISLGQLSSFNQLLVTNGALLTSAGGFIGLSVNARSNVAVIAGVGSTWSNTSVLEIGSAGPFNSLVISNGGFVRNTFGTLGQSGGNNLAWVTGSGSSWSNANSLSIGALGSSNRLVVTDGGTVKSGTAGVGAPGSSNNLVMVSGPNAWWHAGNGLFFGSDSAGNQLVVSNGGLVSATSAELGQFASGSNNVAMVTGPGSQWTNDTLKIGGSSSSNQLIVADGGVVRSGTTFLGFEAPASNSVVQVSGSGSTLHNTGDLFVGFSGPRNRLVMSNGAVARGNFGVIGNTASNNVAVLTGSGTVWSNVVELQVGFLGRANQMVVNNGANLVAGSGFIGKGTGANQNAAFVTDAGSRWWIGTNLFVGSNGALNQLFITNGAMVANGSACIGGGVTSSNNLALVSGSGSMWSNAGNFFVGLNGFGNQLVVSNGALLFSTNACLGSSATSRSNVALLTSAGTIWSNWQTFLVGEAGGGNRLTVSDGARLESMSGFIGQLTAGTNNEVVVTGPGSSWQTEQDLNVGGLGSFNRLVITNGGSVRNNSGAGIGTALSVSNEVVVTGAGSSWALGSSLFVGQVASGCRLVISNGGAVYLNSFGLTVGSTASSTNNRIVVDGGTLQVTNAISGTLDVRRGTLELNAGSIEVSRFLLTNIQGSFQFSGGTFSARNSRVSNGTIFLIGNGTNATTFLLAGNGLHEFTGILTARVSSNATFTGNGIVGGIVPLQFFPGSQLSPGASVGKMVFSNSPALQGTVLMEISKNGATLTNDLIEVIGPLTYGGSLVVSNLGLTALTTGDRVPLFNASSYAGGFTNIILPPLPFGLDWTNKLLLDGSIEVVSLFSPKFTTIGIAGTDVIISGTGGPANAPYAVLTATNVADPLINWTSLGTNQFSAIGEFSFTNAFVPGELQRYFRVRTP